MKPYGKVIIVTDAYSRANTLARMFHIKPRFWVWAQNRAAFIGLRGNLLLVTDPVPQWFQGYLNGGNDYGFVVMGIPKAIV